VKITTGIGPLQKLANVQEGQLKIHEMSLKWLRNVDNDSADVTLFVVPIFGNLSFCHIIIIIIIIIIISKDPEG